MRVALVAVTVALASIMLAGCLGAPQPAPAAGPAAAPPAAPPATPVVALQGCRGSLHVWLLPLQQLRDQVPMGYPVEEYARDGVPTGMGRLLLTFIRCGGDEAGTLRTQAHGAIPMLAVLGVKLQAPAGGADDPALPGDAVALYAIQVYAQQHDLEVMLGATPFPFLAAEHDDSLATVPVLDLPSYAASFQAADGSTFGAEVRAAPPAPEPYARFVRSYFESNGTVGILDLNLTSTLWEGAGTYEASEDSALARVLGQAVPVVDHHILVDLAFSVTAWTESAEAHPHDGEATPRLRERMVREGRDA